jgi:hypothetical protein
LRSSPAPATAFSGEQRLQDLAVCLAMAESARTGRAIDLGKFIGKKP